MKSTIHPVILCGGSGTRLWPLSKPEHPKQFLSLTSPLSMIEQTAARFTSSAHDDLEFGPMLVIGSKRHQHLLENKLPQARKILEPMGRNSAPAVAAACLAHAPEDLILILPADHDIRDVPEFHNAIAVATQAANDGAIVTFGIEPTHPATGYGYIKSNATGSGEFALNVDAFVEKPDLETAIRYLEAGLYFWNAGIFLFKASVMLEALGEFAADVLDGTREAMPQADSQVVELDSSRFAAIPSISIDYAVMERATNVKTVPANMGWSDVGGYRALHNLLTQSEEENCIHGPVHAQNSSGLYVRSEGPVISVNGVSDLVIVATKDEVMITPIRDDAAAKSLGQAVQSRRYFLGLSSELISQAQSWLHTTMAAWLQSAWDHDNGGFVEQLHMDGTPNRKQARRVRVQARQVYSFSQALTMNLVNMAEARTLIDQGIDYIDTRLRHPDGGFVHRIDAAGEILDERRDLYDHAFMILAGASAYRTTGNERALQIAQDSMVFIDQVLTNSQYGGWDESSLRETPRRANPHMHLLEAMLELHAATGSPDALRHAAAIVDLFETRFFNPSTNVMAEFFQPDWSPISDAGFVVFEPGHHYEWATLLSQYSALTGHDTLSWRRRLIHQADRAGLNPDTGLAVNAVRSNGEIINKNSRLWHQLERFRCYLLHPGTPNVQTSEAVLRSIMESYLSELPEGVWIDEVGASGSRISQAVPASMLYHFVTAFELLISASSDQ